MTTAHDTIADRMAAMQAGTAGKLPEHVAAAFTEEQAGLRAAGAPDGIAAPGSSFPDAELLDTAGEPATVAGVAAGRPAVVVLYRGAWCPYCNLTLRSYQELLVPELDRRGIALVAVSPQRPDGSLTMQQVNDLTFAVLSDPGNRIASGLGVLTAPSPEVAAMQVELGLDLTALNADGTRGLPMPTTVLLDRDGTVRWIDVHPDYSGRTEPADVLRAIEAHLPG
jgi:peroxiredoxin